MTTARSPAAQTFIDQGFVAVEHALEPDFCDDVVRRGFQRLGASPDDPSTWPPGWHNLPAADVFPVHDVAPRAAALLDELTGGLDNVKFGDIPDNLIFNFASDEPPWDPPDWRADGAGYHKDGDWFRHFLDSPEQGLLGVVFWRDVDADQGATYIVPDSIAPVARRLAAHPEGLLPSELGIAHILEECRDFRALTGRQGTIVWAHPFLVHSKSVNQTTRPRVLSNTSVMLRAPLQLDRRDGIATPIEQVVHDALGPAARTFRATGPRERVVSERQRRWDAERAPIR